jgi:hypothetical protein
VDEDWQQQEHERLLCQLEALEKQQQQPQQPRRLQQQVQWAPDASPRSGGGAALLAHKQVAAGAGPQRQSQRYGATAHQSVRLRGQQPRAAQAPPARGRAAPAAGAPAAEAPRGAARQAPRREAGARREAPAAAGVGFKISDALSAMASAGPEEVTAAEAQRLGAGL